MSCADRDPYEPTPIFSADAKPDSIKWGQKHIVNLLVGLLDLIAAASGDGSEAAVTSSRVGYSGRNAPEIGTLVRGETPKAGRQ